MPVIPETPDIVRTYVLSRPFLFDLTFTLAVVWLCWLVKQVLYEIRHHALTIYAKYKIWRLKRQIAAMEEKLRQRGFTPEQLA